jgi:hypothetical protein
MKTIGKRDVMKRAWRLYRVGGVRKYFTYKTAYGLIEEQSYLDKNFSECLKRAWVIEKEALTYKNYDMNDITSRMADTISAAYASGYYMGD